VYLSKTIVGAAVLEGVSFLALWAYMLERHSATLVAAACCWAVCCAASRRREAFGLDRTTIAANGGGAVGAAFHVKVFLCAHQQLARNGDGLAIPEPAVYARAPYFTGLPILTSTAPWDGTVVVKRESKVPRRLPVRGWQVCRPLHQPAWYSVE